jgi:hypothetical protein
MLLFVAGAQALSSAPLLPAHPAPAGETSAPDDVQTRVYVLAGGSNMDGRANPDELTTTNLERIRNASMRVQLMYYGGFESAWPDVPSTTTSFEGPLGPTVPNDQLAETFLLNRSFGPELFFGTALAEANPTTRFDLIKHAFGGSTLINASWSNKVPVKAVLDNKVPVKAVLDKWSPGDWREREAQRKGSRLQGPDNLRTSATSRPGEDYEGLIKHVLQRLRDDKSAVLSGVLWVHGEIEGRHPETAGSYADALAEMVAGMRSDLGSPELPFAMLFPWPRGAHLIPVLPEFLSGVHALERDLPHFQLVQATDASPLEVYRDRYTSLDESPFSDEVVLNHYTEAGQRAAGELFARHVREHW